jgi:hypothetical protein
MARSSLACPPLMRFVFLGPELCLQLPSDPDLRRQPLLFGYGFPSPGPQEDLHLQVIASCPAHHQQKTPIAFATGVLT